MAGTNAIAAKKALIDRLKALPALAAVQVEYAWPGKNPEREVIYGGRARFDQEPATFKGAGRIERDERAVVNLHIEVTRPDSDAVTADERVAELGAAIEDDLAANPTMAGAVPMVLHAHVISGEIAEPAFDDDGVTCGIDYEIGFRSFLN